MRQLTTPLEVYKLLPKTNCGECYVPTCLAFSAAVIKGEKKLTDCPHLESSTKEQFAQKIGIREPDDQKREEKLEELKTEIATIELSSIAEKIGANVVNGKLSIKSLGKDFFVDPAGNVTSECHTHAGLTIPLLSYILQSKGTDISGNLVPFRELKNGAPMSPLFGQRCEKPLKQIADNHTELFEYLISIFSGERSKNIFSSDVSLILYPLPKIPILICYWEPEDGMESVLNIFFDKTAEDHLRIESIYALGVGLVMMFEKIVRKHS